jgi:competence protein ComEC
VVLSIFVVIIIIIIKADFQKKLTVTFLDVGQGDCTFIETPNGKNILLDCGPISANFNSAEKNIVPFLERKGIDKIDLMILTHLHKDHIGGFSYLIDNFKISRIMESGQATKNEVREVIDSTIIANKINRDIVGSGDIVEIFGEMKLYILFPNKEYTQLQNLSADDKQLNFTSLAFKLKYRNTDILFLGDIEKEQEEKLINTYDDFLKADLIKISHHGSNTSSVIPLLLKVKPSYSVIFCGLFNMYKNPSFLVLNRLKNLNSTVFRTDLDGALIFQSNGEKIEPVEWH